ncbi:uncharacterized protein LOC127252727 [Andrographis paniculata]|uniref:uncharacterized protein LOC127252727 n=1 Tax=Andrographis paniculata TaxID=175694 RepID=UPI0021E8A697|nr:uncharacterized protein LOC127252727 [Andrographis paniculata]
MSVIAGESPGEKPIGNPSEGSVQKSPGSIDANDFHWADYVAQQAVIAQKTIETTVDNAIETTRSRADQFLTTASAHFGMTIDMMQDSCQRLKSEYRMYENIAFGKIKEGLLVASAHPFITTGSVLGVTFLGLKRTRQFLHYKTLRIFTSEEKLVSKADLKVKELRQSIESLKAESEKLEKRALQAEEDLLRGRTKLKQTGKQIQSVINSAYKIERQAAGLKDVLKELPSREASRFRSQVNNLAKEAKKERNVLSKEVMKISNHGISV